MSEYTDDDLVRAAAENLTDLRGPFEVVIADALIMPMADLARFDFRDCDFALLAARNAPGMPLSDLNLAGDQVVGMGVRFDFEVQGG